MKRGNVLYPVFASVAFLFVSSLPLFAEDTFTATLDRGEIALDETATLILSLKTQEELQPLSPPVIPRIPGLFIFYREMRHVLSPQGGKISPATEFVYILSPGGEGSKTIPPLGIHIQDRLLLTRPLTLKVISKKPGDSFKRTLSGTISKVEKDLVTPEAFVRVDVDNAKPYVNEPIRLTVWAYATVPFQYGGLKGVSEAKGFSRLKEVPGAFLSREDLETRKSETYLGRSLEEQIWFAQESGYHVLELGEVTLLLKTEAKNLFDRSFQEDIPVGHFKSHAEAHVIKVDPISFEVQPLPEENLPEDFSGAVGNFSVTSSLDKSEVEVGQSTTFKVQIRGKGNLKGVKEIPFGKFPFASSFPPRSTDEMKRVKNALVSEKTYEIVLITNHEGRYTIEPISFSYFSPKFRDYRRAASKPLELTIHEKAALVPTTPPKPQTAEPELLGKDIYYLKKEIGPLQPTGSSLLGSPLFWGAQCVPLLILCATFFWRSYQLYLYRNEAVIRRRHAFQTSQIHLKKAEHYLQTGHLQNFARETQEALLGYVSDKTGLLKGALTIEKVGTLIQMAGGGETVQKDVKECLEFFQAIQFASGQPLGKNPKSSFELLKGVLKQLDEIELSAIQKET